LSALIAILLMFSFSSPFWRHLPQLRYVQLPWRWLLVFNVVLALTLVVGFRRWSLRMLFCALALASVLFAGHHILHPWWDSGADLREMVDNQHDGIGNEGADEYVAAGADPYNIKQNAPLATFKGRGTATVRVQRWASEDRIIDVKADSPGTLILRLFNYPLWRATVNGRSAIAQTTPTTGQLALPVSAGENLVQVKFIERLDRVLGLVISFVTMFGLIAWFLVGRRSHLWSGADDRRRTTEGVRR
jgi:hypothetical protein